MLSHVATPVVAATTNAARPPTTAAKAITLRPPSQSCRIGTDARRESHQKDTGHRHNGTTAIAVATPRTPKAEPAITQATRKTVEKIV